MAILLVSCAAATQQASAPPPPPITCQAGPDCEAKWSRAIGWVATNSQWKVQSQSDFLIQTYNSIDDSPSPSFTITKVATGQPGSFEISFNGGCANILGCVPTVAESRVSFAAFVNPAGAAATQQALVWARKDHRRITGNAALEKQDQADRAKCQADANTKGQPGNPAFEEAFKACMNVRGYVIMPLAEAQQQLHQ